ncbi:hypothetical protein R0381_003447 [Jeongeupia wiesaeckerbachi]|uniref:hypothetical protein n=1 Tax=Jeongeupia wiesaeckerbachi TaxID=3051218 RepID=UPI003D8088E5
MFSEKSIESYTSIGFFLGIAAIALAGYRFQVSLNSDVAENTLDDATSDILRKNREADENKIQRYLPTVPLFLSGVIWLVVMQAIRLFMA